MTAGALFLLIAAALAGGGQSFSGIPTQFADAVARSVAGPAMQPSPDTGVRLWRDTAQGRLEIDHLPAAEDVRNPVLGVLVSLIDRDLYGRISQIRLRREVEERGGGRIPWKYFLWIRRQAVTEKHHPEVVVRFLAPLSVPVPYAVLGYHPGRMRSSQKVIVDEWPMGDLSLDARNEEGDRPFLAKNIELFALREGTVEIDIDGLVDRILGGRLDDIRITGMLLFSHEGRRYGLAFGYNPDGKGRTGVLDLSRDELLFPPPKPFLILGRRMRSIAQARQALEAAREKSERGSTE